MPYILFIHLSVEGCIGSFCLLAVVPNAVMIRRYKYIAMPLLSIILSIWLEEGSRDRMVILSVLEDHHVFHSGCIILFFYQQ